jgi:hypothetical protein
MMLLVLILGLVQPIWPAAKCHDFKISVCEVAYEPSGRYFGVKIYLFTDDLTETLTGQSKGPLPSRDIIVQYALKHVELRVNGADQPLQFRALRQKDDQTLVEFTTSPLTGSPLAAVSIYDCLLLEKFQQQTNMVYLLVPGKEKQSEALDRQKPTVTFNIQP